MSYTGSPDGLHSHKVPGNRREDLTTSTIAILFKHGLSGIPCQIAGGEASYNLLATLSLKPSSYLNIHP